MSSTDPAPFASIPKPMTEIIREIDRQIDDAGGFLRYIEAVEMACKYRSLSTPTADRKADTWIARASLMGIVRKHDIEAPMPESAGAVPRDESAMALHNIK